MTDRHIDWYRHYIQKHVYLDLSVERPFLAFAAPHLPTNARLLECGAGLARSAATMVKEGGYRILAVDIDSRLRTLATLLHEPLVADGRLAFAHMDIRFLSRFFRHDSFDACTHSGVLEHFSMEIRESLLVEQFAVAPTIVFSVPLSTAHNCEYFSSSPEVWRELKDVKAWTEEFGHRFSCVDCRVIRQRTDNVCFVLRR
jgi:hypothetical protein